MNRGADRERIFFTINDGLAFERLLAEGTERVAVEVHAYCLMPNHFHLLLHCPDGGLSSFMQQIGSTYSRRINARNGGTDRSSGQGSARWSSTRPIISHGPVGTSTATPRTFPRRSTSSRIDGRVCGSTRESQTRRLGYARPRCPACARATI
jgi:REP element-mobilizing transposase RayT